VYCQIVIPLYVAERETVRERQ